MFGKPISNLLINNGKGVVIKAVSAAVGTIAGGLIAMFASSKLEDGLNAKFNPELEEARNLYANSIDDIMANPCTTKQETDEDCETDAS